MTKVAHRVALEDVQRLLHDWSLTRKAAAVHFVTAVASYDRCLNLNTRAYCSELDGFVKLLG